MSVAHGLVDGLIIPWLSSVFISSFKVSCELCASQLGGILTGDGGGGGVEGASPVEWHVPPG